MWTREELKSNAKMILQRTYWMSFVACLIMGVLTGGGSVANATSEASFKSEQIVEQVSLEILVMMLSVMGVVLVLGTVFTIFVSYPIMIGKNRFFMEGREKDCNLRNLFYVFFSGSYFHVIKTTFLVELYTVLWSLLLVIPGIVKHYEYFFVPYIMSENPGMDTGRAFELSREMSAGRKWDMFVLDLSFIGWNLLGILCCGIGVLFVVPYYQATLAELYAASRAFVLQSGAAGVMELPGYVIT